MSYDIRYNISTVWFAGFFIVIQILREINFEWFRISKTSIFAFFFDILRLFFVLIFTNLRETNFKRSCFTFFLTNLTWNYVLLNFTNFSVKTTSENLNFPLGSTVSLLFSNLKRIFSKSKFAIFTVTFCHHS